MNLSYVLSLTIIFSLELRGSRFSRSHVKILQFAFGLFAIAKQMFEIKHPFVHDVYKLIHNLYAGRPNKNETGRISRKLNEVSRPGFLQVVSSRGGHILIRRIWLRAEVSMWAGGQICFFKWDSKFFKHNNSFSFWDTRPVSFLLDHPVYSGVRDYDDSVSVKPVIDIK